MVAPSASRVVKSVSVPTYVALVDSLSSAVDLKYITSAQVLEVPYEGRMRRFTIISISAQRSDQPKHDEIAHGLESLSVASAPQIWIADWDCEVVLATTADKSKAFTTHKVPQPLSDNLCDVLPTHHMVPVRTRAIEANNYQRSIFVGRRSGQANTTDQRPARDTTNQPGTLQASRSVFPFFGRLYLI